MMARLTFNGVAVEADDAKVDELVRRGFVLVDQPKKKSPPSKKASSSKSEK